MAFVLKRQGSMLSEAAVIDYVAKQVPSFFLFSPMPMPMPSISLSLYVRSAYHARRSLKHMVYFIRGRLHHTRK